MSAEDRPGDLRSLLSLRTIPVYSIFALWSLGTGAQQLARPLFAASFGVPVFLVTVIAATNSLAWMVTAPTTGFLTDRWGRKPLVMAGNALRGLTTLAQFFAPGFWLFLVLEFIGGIGISMWVTGTSIIIADITSGENRGSANAIRSMSARLSMIAGPFVGGFLATFFPLRSIFLFNTLTKIPIHLITAYMIRETRPEAARGGLPLPRRGRRQLHGPRRRREILLRRLRGRRRRAGLHTMHNGSTVSPSPRRSGGWTADLGRSTCTVDRQRKWDTRGGRKTREI